MADVARDKLNYWLNFILITSDSFGDNDSKTIQENSIIYNVFSLFTPFQKSDK